MLGKIEIYFERSSKESKESKELEERWRKSKVWKNCKGIEVHQILLNNNRNG